LEEYQSEETLNPLYYAALYSLGNVIRLLLDKGVNFNAQGGEDGKASYSA
jgi:hypothetical protein